MFDRRTSNPKSWIVPYLTKYFVTMPSTVFKLVCEVQAYNWPNTTSILKQICVMKCPIINLYTPNNAESFWQWCNMFIKNLIFYSINDHDFLKSLQFRSFFSFCHQDYIGWQKPYSAASLSRPIVNLWTKHGNVLIITWKAWMTKKKILSLCPRNISSELTLFMLSGSNYIIPISTSMPYVLCEHFFAHRT
jgi:hypothetical protein